MMSEQNHNVSTQLRFCLSSLEHKDLAEQAAASLSALLCENVDEQLHVTLSNLTMLLKGSHHLVCTALRYATPVWKLHSACYLQGCENAATQPLSGDVS